MSVDAQGQVAGSQYVVARSSFRTLRGRKATDLQIDQYREEKKKRRLSVCFVEEAPKMRQALDHQCHEKRQLLCAVDGSYCNRTVWKAGLERTRILARVRRDAKLCFASSEKGRVYSRETWTSESVRKDDNQAWSTLRCFFGGQWREVRYKEVRRVMWRIAGRHKLLRLIVLAPTPYRTSVKGRTEYRQESYLLSDDVESEVAVLIQAYLDRYQIEFNHRYAKSVLGVGEAQVWGEKSTPRVPEFIVAAYSALLLAGLSAYGPKRGEGISRTSEMAEKSQAPLLSGFNHPAAQAGRRRKGA